MAINGVKIVELRKIPDERGTIMHMLRADDDHFEQFGEVYFSTAYPGVVKGWHEHTRQTQNYAVVQGRIKLVMYDNRTESSTYKEVMEVFMGQDRYCLVVIPPGVVNGYKAFGHDTAIVANCTTHTHDPTEMNRYDPFDDAIPYDWKIVMK